MIRDAIVLGPIPESDTLQFFKFFVAGIDALVGRVEAEAQRSDRLQLRSQDLKKLQNIERYFVFLIGPTRPLFRLFSVVSNKQYNFYKKIM